MGRFAVILPAAGRSARFGSSSDPLRGLDGRSKKKVFAELAGRPVWLRSTEPFIQRDDVVQTILVVSPDDLDWFREKFRANLAFLDLQIVTGGAERADSVEQALLQVRDDVEYIAVHDAARPLIVKPWINAVFSAAEQHGAAILATPVTSTLKRSDERSQIVETVPRQAMWEAQTPQVARRDWLRDAFQRRNGFQPTDEAQLLERAGYPVQLVTGSALNRKITTPEDLQMAEALLGCLPQEKSLRSLHPFADEDPRFR
jgi:2-C-methyl-D-erythritol 4-phosphate cytidylyltransferase